MTALHIEDGVLGGELQHRTTMGGHEVSVVFHQRRPDAVAESLSQAGLPVRARMVRERDDEGDYQEDAQQAFILARKPLTAEAP